MRRRLDLAAALVHRPRILFLDEPTTGLDPASRKALWTVVEDLVADGTTVLLTTQHLDEADRLVGYIVVIDHGRAIAEGTAGELKHRLGTSVMEFGMRDPAAAAAARELLTGMRLGAVGGDGVTVAATVAEGPSTTLIALRALDRERLSPVSVTLREPTLDDAFLALTGDPATTPQEWVP